MNAPLIVGHAGEEVLYVLVPVVLILWLKNVAARRAEREREPTAGGDDAESGSEKPD